MQDTKKIDYRSDFELAIAPTLCIDGCGEPAGIGSYDFCGRLRVPEAYGAAYSFWRRGGECCRCQADGESIRVLVDAGALRPGRLAAELDVIIPDPRFADGSRRAHWEAEDTGVELVAGGADACHGGTIEAAVPVAVLTAYDIAAAEGYGGTRAEYIEACASLPAAVEHAMGVAALAEGAGISANEAAGRAEAAAEGANSAAERADESAALASDAAGQASEAAASAETAAEHAETAATAAEEAIAGLGDLPARVDALEDGTSTLASKADLEKLARTDAANTFDGNQTIKGTLKVNSSITSQSFVNGSNINASQSIFAQNVEVKGGSIILRSNLPPLQQRPAGATYSNEVNGLTFRVNPGGNGDTIPIFYGIGIQKFGDEPHPVFYQITRGRAENVRCIGTAASPENFGSSGVNALVIQRENEGEATGLTGIAINIAGNTGRRFYGICYDAYLGGLYAGEVLVSNDGKYMAPGSNKYPKVVTVDVRGDLEDGDLLRWDAEQGMAVPLGVREVEMEVTYEDDTTEMFVVLCKKSDGNAQGA